MMKRVSTMRLLPAAGAGILLAAVLTVTLMAGRALPRHMAGLDAVLARELGRNRSELADYRCTLGAHRGDSVAHVENTVDAIHSARQDPRYAFIECDIQYSADDTIVAFHDKRLRRVFGEWNKVGASTHAELQQATGGAIATYAEIMDAAAGKRINIEIKSQGDIDEDRRLADVVMADIRARRMEKRVLISSISEDVVRYVSSTYPEVVTGQIFWIKSSTYLPFDFLTRGLYGQIEKSGADYLMLHTANLRNIEDLLRYKPRGKTVVFWDFDDTMYIVHKDLTDRLWGDSFLTTILAQCRYRLRRTFSADDGATNL
jgi:glycerophosphoryl diester phosphodiesterase